jgi:hypothetical protein
MVNSINAIISVIVGAILGSSLTLMNSGILRKLSIKDKEFDWYREKVFNPIIDFTFEGLSVIDKAFLSYCNIGDEIKRENGFNIFLKP